MTRKAMVISFELFIYRRILCIVHILIILITQTFSYSFVPNYPQKGNILIDLLPFV
jgi:hypothetical protein